MENDESIIKKQHLFADMIAHAWFTVNYFHVSFGKHDKLQQAIANIRLAEGLTVDAERRHIYQSLTVSNQKTTLKELWYFNSEVPHRFLSPWFKAADMQLAYQYSQTYTNKCLRAISKETITINPAWKEHLIQQLANFLDLHAYSDIKLTV